MSVGLIQLHDCLNAGKVNMQQLQGCGNNDWLHWGFGANAFILDALLTAANHPLHLGSHGRPPEVIIQQAQCLPLALVSSIKVTSIHGSYPVSLWDHKSQNFLQFTSGLWQWYRAAQQSVILLCFWRIVLPSSVFASSPIRCLSFCTFQSNPFNHSLECRILLLGVHPVSHMQVYTCNLSQNCSFLEGLVCFHQLWPLPGHEHLPFW